MGLDSIRNYTMLILTIEHCIGELRLKNLGEVVYWYKYNGTPTLHNKLSRRSDDECELFIIILQGCEETLNVSRPVRNSWRALWSSVAWKQFAVSRCAACMCDKIGEVCRKVWNPLKGWILVDMANVAVELAWWARRSRLGVEWFQAERWWC